MLSEQQPYSLIVVTARPEALPCPQWRAHREAQDTIFGFHMAYYNPHKTDHTYTLGKECLGFYPVEGPFPKRPTCEINADSILEILLLELPPGEALKRFYRDGWPGLLAITIDRYVLHPEVSVKAVA